MRDSELHQAKNLMQEKQKRAKIPISADFRFLLLLAIVIVILAAIESSG